MAFVLSDRIKETTTTTGTGTYTLGGAVSGFETFTANLSNSDTTYYCCTDGTDFEVGLGTFTSSGTTLARTTIISSSNSNNAVSWSSGSRDIFCTLPGSKAVFKDGDGHASFADNERVRFGSDNDAYIRHTGSLLQVIADTGGINIKANESDKDVTLQTDDGSGGTTDYLRADGSTGAVKLSHYGSTKLETTSGGVTITGALTGNVTGDLTGNADTASSVAADNLSAGDSAVNLRTTSGNITIDAQGSDTDIIFKGTDGSSDITALTLDMSNAGTASFNGGVQSNQYFWMKTDNNVSMYSGANFEILLQHVHNTGLKLINNGTGTPAVELQLHDSDEAIGSDGTNLKLTSGGNEIIVPNSGADTMTLNAATQTLTNKTLTSPKINEDVAVTATATEINKLDGLTATTTELNYVDVTTLGTVEASKAVTADSSGHVNFQDSQEAKFGTSGDLRIFHNGSHSVVKDDGTGNLELCGSTVKIRNAGRTKDGIVANQGGSVELYHDNSKKLETTSDGATVTGSATISSTADGGPVLNLISNDPSDVGDFGIEGTINYLAENSASEQTTFAQVKMLTDDVTDGTEDGRLIYEVIKNGTLTDILHLTSTNILIYNTTPLSWYQPNSTNFVVQINPPTPTASRNINLPDASGTVLTTGNSDTPTTTTSSSDADFVLVDDGGTMKKITPSNLGITSGGASKGFAVAMAIAL